MRQTKWNVSQHGWYLTFRDDPHNNMLAFVTRPTTGGDQWLYLWNNHSTKEGSVKPAHKCIVPTLLEGQRLAEDYIKGVGTMNAQHLPVAVTSP